MPLRARGFCALAAVAIAAAGCGTHRNWISRAHPEAEAALAADSEPSSDSKHASECPESVVPVSGADAIELVAPSPAPAATGADDLFVGLSELPLGEFVAAVQARNPSLQAAQAAWSAAAQRYPQMIALDDPMLQTMLAPASLSGNSPVQQSYLISVSQKIPWHGKRALRGEIALWEANAAGWDIQEVQLRLSLAASLAYFDYYLVQRDLEITRSNLAILEDIQSTAKSRYEANLVSAQDLSLAELELAKLEQRQLELLQMQRIAAARINTLLHRNPEHPLPPIITALSLDADPIDVAHWQQLALQQRPELSALSSRIQADQNAVALACKEYYPDFEVMARYDSFWTDIEQRGIVGLNMNLPVNRDKRAAAVNEAIFRLSRLHAEYAQLTDSIREDIAASAARVEQARGVAQLYEQRVLPAAEISLNDAKAAYVAGTVDFQRLLLARRQLADEQLGYQRTLVDYRRYRAQLNRAVGQATADNLSPTIHTQPRN